MNKGLLLALQKRNKEKLGELKGKVEDPELRAADLPAIEEEIKEITKQLEEIAEELANDDEGDEGSGEDGDEGDDGSEGRSGEDGDEGDDDKGGDGTENRSKNTLVSPENRSAIQSAIAGALNTRAHKSAASKQLEQRAAFGKFVVGQITESEARALGVATNNGSVLVPEVVAKEIITYASEENLLRKYGTRHKTAGNVKYPVLVKKAEANVVGQERHIVPNPIPETDIEFDEVYLNPVEFDALATISKKLINMADPGYKVEDIVIEELKKAYVRKEASYMFNGNDPKTPNDGALAKKAVAYYESAPVDLTKAGLENTLYRELVKMKGQVSTAVRKKAMWIINNAALTVLEGLLDGQGRPLLYDTGRDEVSYKLLGHMVDFTDDADGADSSKPVFYFGDIKTFHIQDVIGVLEIQKLVEKYSDTNRIGFQIYNLLDGKLIYSPFEPSVYRYEVGMTAPTTGE